MNASTQSQKSFVAQMKEFFGLLPGQSLTGFAVELKTLSDEEKQVFAAMLNAAGFPCTLPDPIAAGI